MDANDFVRCLVPPSIPTEERSDLSSSDVLLDTKAYISAAAVSNATTAIGKLSNGTLIHVSFCLARPPRLSYLCVHFPGPAAVPVTFTPYIPHGTPAVRCVMEAPKVISTHADLALLRVARPGALDFQDFRSQDYFVYTARPLRGQSMLHRLPHPKHAAFNDNEVAIFRCPGSTSRYVVAALRNTVDAKKFKLQLYDSKTGRWTSTPLPVDTPERDTVLPIPDTATQVLFHDTTKVITLGGPRATIGWVDLWRGILLCDVLDAKPVLRDVPLPKPMRINRGGFCRGCPHRYRDITVVKLSNQDIRIKYVEMGTRPGEDLPPPPPQSVNNNSYYSDDDDIDGGKEHNFDVSPYWNAAVWTMPVPIASWKNWHRDEDCQVDVTDIIVDNPRHSKLLLPLPRLRTDPQNATMSLRRLLTAHPTLGLGADGDVVIYLLSKVDYMDNRGWVIAVGARDKKLRGIVKLDSRKNRSFRRYYRHSEISNYLTSATGDVGALEA